MKILYIPADSQGNKLWLKEYEKINGKHFIKYKSTFNDMPFIRTEIFVVDDSFVICGDDGTVLYRFSKRWLP